MKVVVLAGGAGSRLAQDSEILPKPMIEIGGRPILWHVMKTYAHFGMTDLIVCLGYKGYMVKEYFANFVLHNSDVTVDAVENRIDYRQTSVEPWRVTLVDTGEGTMTGGRLKRVGKYLDPGEPFCLTYCDCVADLDVGALVAFHLAHGKLATLTAVVPPGRFGAVDLDGDAVRRFTEKPPGDSAGFINGGFFVLDPKVLDRIEGDATPWELSPLQSLASEGELKAFRHSGFWQPLDTLRDKHLLDEMWSSHRAPWRVWP